MGYELGPKRSAVEVLMTPGPLLAMAGALILLVSVIAFNHSTPAADVDAIIEAQAHNGARIKSMLGMVGGTLTCLAGALWSLMTMTRGR